MRCYHKGHLYTLNGVSKCCFACETLYRGSPPVETDGHMGPVGHGMQNFTLGNHWTLER